jgi:ATP-binding cassette subfamily F protein 3
LKKLSEDYLRLAQKVQIERDDPALKLKFPDPTWPPGLSKTSPLIRLDEVSFGYDANEPFLLHDLTLNLTRGSKVALVGKNGCGKTSLIRLITGEIDTLGKIKGDLWRHPSLRIGHVTQYSVEELEEFSHITVVEYAEEIVASGKASLEAYGSIRQYLGAFGLGGAHAHRPIGKLSGGERMRLCFATVLADQPHLLFLDESTNHVDLETLDSMAAALKTFQGAVLMVSHNQGFLNGFCSELWVLEDGHVSVTHDDTETFDELFSQYRSHVVLLSASTRTYERRVKADMAKWAAKQSVSAKRNTTLLA